MMILYTSGVKEGWLSKPVISSIAPLSATNSLYKLTEEIDRKRPAAASQGELDFDLRRFTVRFMQPGNCMIASIHFFPPSEYFQRATIACSLSRSSWSSPSIRTNKAT